MRFVDFAVDGSELDLAALGLEIAAVAGEIEAGVGAGGTFGPGGDEGFAEDGVLFEVAADGSFEVAGDEGPVEVLGEMLRLSGCMWAAISWAALFSMNRVRAS